MANTGGDPKAQPELVFGLVGPLGTDLELVAAHLKDFLALVRYRAEVFRLSHFMREIKAEPWSKLKDGPEDEVIKTHIDAGQRPPSKTESERRNGNAGHRRPPRASRE
jgi:hypothetical protein